MNATHGDQHDIESLTVQLEAAVRELDEFSYSVSHDLRAPLRAIDGFSRILLLEKSAALPADAQRYLRLIRENTQQLGELIDSLLAFSRLNHQGMVRERLEPAEVARNALTELQMRPEQEGRDLVVTIHDLPACYGDPALIKQVYVNLLDNALKYTRKNQETGKDAIIEVGFRREENEVVYFVKDNGVGFDMRYAARLFGMFQKMHRAADYKGTGAGLATVQRITARHGGRVWAEAEVNVGATFCFTLQEEVR